MTLLHNTLFQTMTIPFLHQHFISAAGMRPLTAGIQPFNLNHHLIEMSGRPRSQVVTLEPWRPEPDEQQMAPPINGYWLPQGKSCLIPIKPQTVHFLFTPDFSGCSIMVDQISETDYRVYHVQGGSNYWQTEYANKDHGLGVVAEMHFETYGLPESPRAFAFLKYEHEDNQWYIYIQSQTGVGLSYRPDTGELTTNGDQLPREIKRIPIVNTLHT